MTKLLTATEVSDLTGIPESTLAQWRYRKRWIPYLRIGGLVRYDADDVHAYLQSCKIGVRGQLTGKRGEDVRLS